MSKSPRLRELLEKQHGEWVKTSFESERHHVFKFINHFEGICIGKSVF